jgi:hypothetical protein
MVGQDSVTVHILRRMKVSKQIMRGCAIVALITSGIFLGACTPNDETDKSSAPTASGTPQAGNSATNAAYGYGGAVDGRSCEAVSGWVLKSIDPHADVKVELYVDDKLVETAPAKTLRPDLKAKNIGTGEYGFSLTIPPTFKDGNVHTVSVKVAGSDYIVPIIPGVNATVNCKP